MAKKEAVEAEVTVESFNRGAAQLYTRRDLILVIGPVEQDTTVETKSGVHTAHPGDYIVLEDELLDIKSEPDVLEDLIVVSENKRHK